MNPIKRAALAYAREGLPVFPVFGIVGGACACGRADCSDQGKHPATPNGLGGASTDPEQIARWFDIADSYPDALNVGIAVPPGRLVVDVDPRNGGDVNLAEFERENGPLPLTRAVRTGGGGLHLWYTLAPELTAPARLTDGVDLQGAGKYVIAPPSLHLSGKRYEWLTPDGVDWRSIAEAPLPTAIPSYPRGDRSDAVDVLDLDEPTISDADRDAVLSILDGALVDGSKHRACVALGGWLKQRGWNSGDCATIVGELLTRTPNVRSLEAGVRAALYAYAVEKPYGFGELREVIAPERVAALERTRSPAWEAEIAERAEAARIVAPALATPAAPAAALTLDGLGDVLDLSQDPPDLQCVVPGLEITHGKISAIVAYANGGKTPLALQLALCVANGAPFLGHATERGRVGFLCWESAGMARRRLRRIAKALRLDVAGVDVVRMQRSLSELDVPQKIADAIHARGWRLVIGDTYGAAVVGVDHNTSAFSDAAKRLEQVSETMRTPIVMLLHSKKDSTPGLQEIAGHNSIAGAIQMAISVHRSDLDDVHTFELRCIRELEKGFKPIKVRAVDVAPADIVAATDGVGFAFYAEGETLPSNAPAATPKPPPAPERMTLDEQVTRARERVLSFAAGVMHQDPTQPIKQQTIISVTAGRRRAVIKALKELEADGLIQRAPGYGRAFWWRLPPTEAFEQPTYSAHAPPTIPPIHAE